MNDNDSENKRVETNSNEWRRTYIATMSNAKLKKFARLMGISLFEARGLWEAFWDWVCMNAQDGSLEGFDMADILADIGWDGDPDQFLKCALNCGARGHGFLEERDGKLVIHEWVYNIGDRFGKRKRDAERKKQEREQNKANVEHKNTVVQRTSDGYPKDVRSEKRGDEMSREKIFTPPTPPKGDAPVRALAVAAQKSAPQPDLKAKPKPEAKKPAVTLGFVMRIWNEKLAPIGFREVLKASPARERAFNARVAEDARRAKPEWWDVLISRIGLNPFFLKSARDKAQWLELDWFLKETNLVKVLEGKYDRERTVSLHPRDRPSQNAQHEKQLERSYDEIARELGFYHSDAVIDTVITKLSTPALTANANASGGKP